MKCYYHPDTIKHELFVAIRGKNSYAYVAIFSEIAKTIADIEHPSIQRDALIACKSILRYKFKPFSLNAIEAINLDEFIDIINDIKKGDI